VFLKIGLCVVTNEMWSCDDGLQRPRECSDYQIILKNRESVLTEDCEDAWVTGFQQTFRMGRGKQLYEALPQLILHKHHNQVLTMLWLIKINISQECEKYDKTYEENNCFQKLFQSTVVPGIIPAFRNR